jgi:DNA-binding NarL/FixJ family response regulator
MSDDPVYTPDPRRRALRLVEATNDPVADAARALGLTPAELLVLQAAARGYTARETARFLHKGIDTVKTQRVSVLVKFGARNIAHAVCIASEHGLVSSAPPQADRLDDVA